jgi:hypothetical protein
MKLKETDPFLSPHPKAAEESRRKRTIMSPPTTQSRFSGVEDFPHSHGLPAAKLVKLCWSHWRLRTDDFNDMTPSGPTSASTSSFLLRLWFYTYVLLNPLPGRRH